MPLFTKRDFAAISTAFDDNLVDRKLHTKGLRGCAIVFSLWACVCGDPSSVCAQQLPSPYAIVFDNGRANLLAVARREELIASMSDHGTIRPRSAESIQELMFHRFTDALRFEATTGIAYFVAPSGKRLRLRFREVQSAAVFHDYVENIRSRRGGEITLGKTEFVKTISNRVPNVEADGRITTFVDVHCVYSDGLCVWSDDPEVEYAPFRELAELAKRGTGKDWSVWIDLKSIPSHQRAEYLEQVEAGTSVKLQRRDAEPIEPYTLRRALGQNYLVLWQSFLFDVEEAYAWTREPREGHPFKAHFEIHAKPKSDLASLIREFRPERSSSLQIPADTTVAATVNCRIPQSFRPSLRALVAASPLSSTPLAAVFVEIIDVGRCELAAWIKSTEDQQPVAGARFRTTTEAMNSETIASAFRGTVNVDGDAVFHVDGNALGQSFGDHGIAISLKDSQLQLDSSPRELKPSASSPTNADDGFVTIHPSLASLHIDLGHWAAGSPGAPTRQLLDKLERAYQQWTFERVSAAARLYIYGNGKALDHFYPLTQQLKTEGDWTLDVSIFGSRNGESLTVDVSVGRELYAYCCARQILTREAIGALRAKSATPEAKTFRRDTK
ncbi:MAG: hypothetical protein JNL58_15810 [Planctomyces sp.]|nr:hypothetical protein [Planctomyces sp.]